MTLVYYKSQCQRDMQYYGSAGLGASTVSLYELYGNNVLGALTAIRASTLLIFFSSLDPSPIRMNSPSFVQRVHLATYCMQMSHVPEGLLEIAPGHKHTSLGYMRPLGDGFETPYTLNPYELLSTLGLLRGTSRLHWAPFGSLILKMEPMFDCNSYPSMESPCGFL